MGTLDQILLKVLERKANSCQAKWNNDLNKGILDRIQKFSHPGCPVIQGRAGYKSSKT